MRPRFRASAGLGCCCPAVGPGVEGEELVVHWSAIFVALLIVNCSAALAVAELGLPPVLAEADPGVAEAVGPACEDALELIPLVEAELPTAVCPVTWTSFPTSVRTLSRLPVSL
jgi:hypothetical protein